MLVCAFGAFFVMGVAGAMATTLVPLVPSLFDVGLTAAMTVQWIALVVSGGASLLLARQLQWSGPRSMMLGGLCVVAGGCALVGMAISPPLPFALLVAALAVVALGITALQVVANLCAVSAGPAATSAARLAAAQAFNSLGVLAGVCLGATLALGSGRLGAGIAYAITGIVTAAVIAVALFVPRASWQYSAQDDPGTPLGEALRSPGAWIGAVTIALYVGAEGTIGSLLIPYLHQPSIMNLDLASAGQYVAWGYWGSALIGRAAGYVVLKRLPPTAVLATVATLAFAGSLGAIVGSGPLPGWALISIGFCNALMFPVIFALTLDHADAPPAAISGLLSTAVAGGAVMSMTAGYFADRVGIAFAFAVPACAYVAIIGFALWIAGRSRWLPHDSRITSSVGSRSDLTS
ncbi:MFS transporter [Novosphingobium cyanobacteriorum]|nr:MFS transporter [Novosphingobium cyanobacteriorum]